MDFNKIAKILVVDDEPLNREILVNLLVREGYDALFQEDGAKAIESIPVYEPDLILLDILMPGINGFEVTRKLKSDEKYRHIPIILQTGLDDRESCLHGLGLGAEDYITKPVDPSELLIRIRNLLRLKKLNDLLRHNNQILVDYDYLTGLPNRNQIARLLKEKLEGAIAAKDNIGVIIMSTQVSDINRSHGTVVGDLILQEIAKRLLRFETNQIHIGLIDGNRFAVIINGSELNIVRHTKQIQKEFEKPFVAANQKIFITSYMGIAQSLKDGEDWETLYRHAEIALSKAEQSNPNSYQFFSSKMDSQTLKRITLEQELHQAIKREEFVLYYQPQVDLKSGKINGVEALVRWQHPTDGFVSPADFIPLAEECGLIVPITQWVLNTACTQLKAWRDMGYLDLSIAVNISSHHFKKGKLVLDVCQALKKTGLNAENLELEITEGTMVSDSNMVEQTLSELQKMGVKLSIDDFGTGYSSLSYLQRLTVDRIKIDQSFIYDIVTNPGNAVIACSIITMAHQFDYKVIAEGVETEDQLSALLREHCDEIQGYYFSRPLPADEFEQLLKGGHQLTIKKMDADRTLLIVDGDPNRVDTVVDHLSEEGFRTMVVKDAVAGLEKLKNEDAHNARPH